MLQVIKKAGMSVDDRSCAPRPSPLSVLHIALPSIALAKMHAWCSPFGSASALDRARMFQMWRPSRARPFHACVESNEMSAMWSPGGESAHLHVARAHALRQLFVRAHLFPFSSGLTTVAMNVGAVTRFGCPT